MANHLQNSGLLETVWAYTAADGDLHGAKGEGAIDADALGGDLDLVVVVSSGGGGGGGGILGIVAV